ncbi:MAG: hypothetical protein DCC65_08635 [Planctomycetota bacterium]|nr:MAG: hypothetical protein DCC65_08635 [Planctomycetota bacterium]
MRQIRWIALALLASTSALFVHVAPANGQPLPPPGAGSFMARPPMMDMSFFYESLAPYGEWIHMPQFGWVWSPYNMQYDWRPYQDGYWVWTEYGWTWVSNEPFGWAVYHYGRWIFDRYYGWVWVPGRVWGPAWVAWRQGAGWVGWAPLPPDDTIHANVRIGPFHLRFDTIRNYHWNFVEERRFCEGNIRPYIARSVRNVNIVHQTRNVTNYNIVNNTIVNNNINIVNIEKRIGRSVPRYSIRDAAAPDRARVVQGNALQIYRPRLSDAKPRRTPDQIIPRGTSARGVISNDRVQEDRTALQRRIEREQEALRNRQLREAERYRKKGVSDDELKRRAEREKQAFDEQEKRQRRLLEKQIEREQKGERGPSKSKDRKYKND